MVGRCGTGTSGGGGADLFVSAPRAAKAHEEPVLGRGKVVQDLQVVVVVPGDRGGNGDTTGIVVIINMSPRTTEQNRGLVG